MGSTAKNEAVEIKKKYLSNELNLKQIDQDRK